MDEFLKALMEALNSGVEVTISLKKPVKETRDENRVVCPDCGWKHTYTRHDAARRGWETHKAACKAKKKATFEPPTWLKDQVEGRQL